VTSTVPDIQNGKEFLLAGRVSSFILTCIVTGTPGGRGVGSIEGVEDEGRREPTDDSIEVVCDAETEDDGAEPSKEYSATLCAGRGPRRREDDDDAELCRDMPRSAERKICGPLE
jgi:hypothetical protein